MSAAWLAYVALVSGLVCVAAQALDGVARRMRKPTRWIWALALGAIIASGGIAPRGVPAAKAVRMQGVALRPTGNAEKVRESGLVVLLRELPAEASDLARRAASAIASYDAPNLMASFILAWALAAGALAAAIAIITLRLRQARRHWPVAVVQGTEVRISERAGPAVVGLVRPDIVLPRWLLRRSASEQQIVVQHEREHVAAHDQVLLLGAWMTTALMPWNPAMWFALSRIRLALEIDCDARVLARGVAPRSYGSLLIDIAGECAGQPAGALALADHPSHLELRLRAMKQTSSRFAPVRTAVLGAIASVALLAACEARMPTSAELNRADVASLEKSAAEFKTISDGTRSYYVDGKLVSEAEAKGLAAPTIERVNFMKKGEKHSVVMVTTKDGLHSGDTVSMTMAPGQGMKVKEALMQPTMMKERSKEPPLFYVNGVKASADVMRTLSKDSIESAEVVKGTAAAKLTNDPAAAYGVIYITTKKP